MADFMSGAGQVLILEGEPKIYILLCHKARMCSKSYDGMSKEHRRQLEEVPLAIWKLKQII